MNQPPAYDEQAEMGCVGSVLLDPKLLFPVAAIVQPRDFHDPAVRSIFASALALAADCKPVDPIVVVDHLKAIGQLEAVGGAAFVSKMFRVVPNAAHATYYAEIVRDHARRRRQQMLAQQVARLASAGGSPDEINEVLTAHLEYDRARDFTNGFDLLTCNDLANAPEQEYLAKGLIPRGQPGAIGAPYKGMKTSICCDIVVSLATGGCVLGLFEVPRPVKVLFMSAESGLQTLRKTTQAICEAAGIRFPDDLENLQWCTSLPKLGVDADLRKLDAAFKAFPFEVLICDPLFKMCSGDGAENIMKQGDKFLHLQKWCDEHAVTLVFVHHLTKPASRVYEPAELGDLSYAGIAEHVRWWILLSRREKYLPPDPIHKLWFSSGGSAGHSGLWACDIDLGEYVEGQPRQWDVTLQEAHEVRQEAAERKAAVKNQAKLNAAQAKAQANLETLLNTLKGYPDGETKTVLRTRSGLHTSALDSAIYDALQSKQIEPCQVFKAGRKQGRDGYRIPSGASGASGKNADSPDAPNAQTIGEGNPLCNKGSRIPDASGELPNDLEPTIGETEAAA